MSPEERFHLIARGAVEVVTEDELRATLSEKRTLKVYVGFEPSGFLHIASGGLVAEKLKDFVAAGLDVTVLLADWHALINDKFGGNLEAIRACGEYLRDGFTALGVPPSVRYVTASDLVSKPDYWRQVLAVSKHTTMARMRRALSIMGRKEEEAELDASKLIYPAMQVADVHVLGLDLAYGGLDQRHAHMLYRDVAPKLGWKPVIAVHTPLITSLLGGGRMDSFDAKMSKSKPEGCVFLHDSSEEVRRKIGNAYCPKAVEGNPVLEMARWLVFPRVERFAIHREAAHGGDASFGSYEELEARYLSGLVHPADLKAAVASSIDAMLAPVRRYFEQKPENLRALQRYTGG